MRRHLAPSLPMGDPHVMTPKVEAMLRRAGFAIPASAKAMQGVRLAPGALVVEFRVLARPIPWRAAHTTRTGHSFKNKTLVAWQATVKDHATLAMGRMAPYSHPVALVLEFFLVPIKGRTLPDLSNLNKSTEDSLQGVVIENDRQVHRITSRRFVGVADEARIRVYAMEAD
jgi:Holliday junction resolvase RusA-like endonuclease